MCKYKFIYGIFGIVYGDADGAQPGRLISSECIDVLRAGAPGSWGDPGPQEMLLVLYAYIYIWFFRGGGMGARVCVCECVCVCDNPVSKGFHLTVHLQNNIMSAGGQWTFWKALPNEDLSSLS